MRSNLLFAVATALALSLAAGAHADVLPSGYEQHSVTVPVGDLNLDTNAGASKALARIAFAANHVCGDAGDNLDLRHRAQHRACLNATVEHALATLDSPRVSEIYARPPRMTLAEYRGN